MKLIKTLIIVILLEICLPALRSKTKVNPPSPLTPSTTGTLRRMRFLQIFNKHIIDRYHSKDFFFMDLHTHLRNHPGMPFTQLCYEDVEYIKITQMSYQWGGVAYAYTVDLVHMRGLHWHEGKLYYFQEAKARVGIGNTYTDVSHFDAIEPLNPTFNFVNPFVKDATNYNDNIPIAPAIGGGVVTVNVSTLSQEQLLHFLRYENCIPA